MPLAVGDRRPVSSEDSYVQEGQLEELQGIVEGIQCGVYSRIEGGKVVGFNSIHDLWMY